MGAYAPIKSIIGVTEKHICRRCKRTLPIDRFGILTQSTAGTKLHAAMAGARMQILHPFCWTCRDQIRGRHIQHDLYTPKLDRFIERKFSSIKANSRSRGLPVLIDKDYLLGVYLEQGGLCAFSGFQMTLESGNGCRNNTSASVDRIDSGKGYIAGNVHFVCDIINVMKSTLPSGQFIEWCRRVVEKQANVQDDLLQGIDAA